MYILFYITQYYFTYMQAAGTGYSASSLKTYIHLLDNNNINIPFTLSYKIGIVIFTLSQTLWCMNMRYDGDGHDGVNGTHMRTNFHVYQFQLFQILKVLKDAE